MISRLFNSGFKFHFIENSLAAYSLNGMSSSTLPWDRAKLIKECWEISKKSSEHFPEISENQRKKAYIAWILNEVFALPARYFLKPPTSRIIKNIINTIMINFIKKTTINSEYGKW